MNIGSMSSSHYFGIYEGEYQASNSTLIYGGVYSYNLTKNIIPFKYNLQVDISTGTKIKFCFLNGSLDNPVLIPDGTINTLNNQSTIEKKTNSFDINLTSLDTTISKIIDIPKTGYINISVLSTTEIYPTELSIQKVDTLEKISMTSLTGSGISGLFDITEAHTKFLIKARYMLASNSDFENNMYSASLKILYTISF